MICKSFYIKFTIISLLLNVNNIVAQVSYNSVAERQADVSLKEKLKQNTSFKDFKFRNVGPSIMSGRVTDVAVDANNPTSFYVAYATGGLWYTQNNGQSFKPVFDQENNIGIGAIAMHWKTNSLWVGTGEANSSRSSYAGDGVYLSTDSGKTWMHKGLESVGHIGRIICNPNNENELWVAAIGNLYSANMDRGLYHSIDKGKTWTKSLYIDANTGVIDVAVNPNNTKEIYAAAWYRTRRAWNFEESGATSAIYKSSDGGKTWTNVSKNGIGMNAGIGRMGIAVAASNPNVVYVVLDNQNHRPDTAAKKPTKNYMLNDFKDISKENFAKLDSNKLDSFLLGNGFDKKYTARQVMQMVADGTVKSSAIYDYLFDANTALFNTPVIGAEVYRSDDAGNTWKKVNKKALALFNTYGYYFANISVAPNDPNKIVIGGYDLESSDDGGASFKVRDNAATHADWHVTWINPTNNKHWIAGNDGGLNITYDDGQHWFKANTPSVGQFYNIAVDNATPYNVYGGLQDNGTWFGSSKTKDSDQWDYESPYPWKQVGGGDGMQVQVDTRDNKTMYGGSQFGFSFRRTTDGGRSRTSIYPRSGLGENLYRYNWQTPILLSKYNQDILYYGTNILQRSFDQGESFTAISPDLTKGKVSGDVPFGTTTTIAESAVQFGLLYVGTDDGNVYVTKDAGLNWTAINAGLPANKYISKITASSANAERVYVAASGYREDDFKPYIFRSDNSGKTWMPIFTGLPLGSINVVIEDPTRKDMIFVGTDNAVYVSLNAGTSFQLLSNNLPTVPVHDIKIQEREKELVIGTHGRSIYIASLKDLYKEYDSKK